jgi:hypothetical protein
MAHLHLRANRNGSIYNEETYHVPGGQLLRVRGHGPHEEVLDAFFRDALQLDVAVEPRQPPVVLRANGQVDDWDWVQLALRTRWVGHVACHVDSKPGACL